MSLPVLPAGPTTRRRPPVLDASRTALIPLRPLTIGEILDGGFLIVRRNVRLMLGLPLVVAGGTAAYVLIGVGGWLLLGNTTARSAQIVLTVLMGLLGLLLLQQCLVWMTAILSRVSLQTVLGDGFAPSVSAVTLRSSLPLFWPVLGLSLLQYLVVNVVQTAITAIYYAVVIGVVLTGTQSETLGIIGTIALSVVTYLVVMVVYSYLSMTVPALSTESRHAPAWIGKPAKPTTVISAFGRAFSLIGKQNLVRVALLTGGMVAICIGLVALVAAGAAAILYLFATSINLDVFTVLTNPWTVFGLVSFSVLVAMSAVLAYVSAVQTLLYLDLRMRREGLDLAMRFDCMPIPQPVAPPVVWQGNPWPVG
ncbi:MAG TPA: hypothetical protein VIT20_06735 [Propionibacteriaceae bacterium]